MIDVYAIIGDGPVCFCSIVTGLQDKQHMEQKKKSTSSPDLSRETEFIVDGCLIQSASSMSLPPEECPCSLENP